MLSCQSRSLLAVTKSIMTWGQQRAMRTPALVYTHTHTYTHTTLCLTGLRTAHYLPRTQANPHAKGALHVTQHSEIFKHHIQTKKPCQTVLDDMKCGRAVDGVRAEQVSLSGNLLLFFF